MKPAAIFLALALAVSAADRKSHRPQVALPDRWSAPASPAPGELDEIRTCWRSFRDPILTSLVERGIESNLDLKAALARVLESRAARGLAGSALMPSVSTSEGFTRLRGGIAQGLTGVGV